MRAATRLENDTFWNYSLRVHRSSARHIVASSEQSTDKEELTGRSTPTRSGLSNRKRAPITRMGPMTQLVALPDGTELAGDYKIVRVLGAGGFGVTYLAEEPTLGRKISIKEYFPS